MERREGRRKGGRREREEHEVRERGGGRQLVWQIHHR